MRVFTLAAAFFAGLTVSSSQAASLRVAPVLLDLKAPTAASSLRIWNDAKTPINVQVRIFRWTQKNGQDVYTAAQDVVASPPMTQLKGGAENLIRIVRLSKARCAPKRATASSSMSCRRREDRNPARLIWWCATPYPFSSRPLPQVMRNRPGR